MNRTLFYLRPLTSMLLSAALLFTLTATKCGENKTPEEEKAEFIGYAKQVRDGLVKAGPFILKFKPALESKYNSAVSIANQLVTAVEASNSTEVADLLVEMIPVFDDIVGQFTDNTTVLTILFVVDGALRFFANRYKTELASAPVARRSTAQGNKARSRVLQFASRKAWRCRNSQTGRFEKMEFCESHPDITQVETR